MSGSCPQGRKGVPGLGRALGRPLAGPAAAASPGTGLRGGEGGPGLGPEGHPALRGQRDTAPRGEGWRRREEERALRFWRERDTSSRSTRWLGHGSAPRAGLSAEGRRCREGVPALARGLAVRWART